MKVFSPYGKNVLLELESVYGFSSMEAFNRFLVSHIRENYSLQDFEIRSIHVAFGVTVEIKAGASFFLKFASLTMHSRPEQLFPWLDYLHKESFPIPKIIPSKNGAWFLSPLQKSDYKVVYLMQGIDGKPSLGMDKRKIRQYAKLMSDFHRIGAEYPEKNLGSIATWGGKWSNRNQLWDGLAQLPHLNRTLIDKAVRVVEKNGAQEFPKTIIHGDFRLCHVLFEGKQIRGIIDIDQSTQGEKFVDLCYGLVSGASPESGSLLNHEQVIYALNTYHQFFPLTKNEIASLKAFFSYAALETLSELAGNVMAGTAKLQEIQRTEQLLEHILETEVFVKA